MFSETEAGSDLANLATRAERDGDEYVINGSKTYITNGTRADFVTLMVKTDPEAGHSGISIIVCPTDVNGFSISKKLEKAGNWASDTAELFFEDVRVPQRYLLGQEGMGFAYLMQNFQTERLIAAVSATAACLNNLGPGLGNVAQNYAGITDAGKWILSFAMLLRYSFDLGDDADLIERYFEIVP